MNKEEVYDSQISPLMRQIIAICQKHGISMIADFAIPTPSDPDLGCMSILPDENGKNKPTHLEAAQIISPASRPPVILRTVAANGDVTLMAVCP